MLYCTNINFRQTEETLNVEDEHIDAPRQIIIDNNITFNMYQ